MDPRTLSLIGLLALLGSACSTRPVQPEPLAAPARPVAKQAPATPHERIDSDELLRFGAHLAQATPPERKTLCRDLLKREREHADPVLQLKLMVGRTLSRSCGDIAAVLKWVSGIPSDHIAEDRLRWLIARDSAVLREMRRLERAASQAPRTRRSARVQGRPTQAQQDETARLRQKLEEIRAIERQLDGDEVRD
ncbi:hypothetical protein [Methylotetracoccus oryzae]|uniref:hypothetical protein n=1 Tax=Methylotetracoccus oryzae TaxID=1919059 RepID=UPI00111ACA21|nr:hypothetical protein [Methylotetracoccus oryzae]